MDRSRLGQHAELEDSAMVPVSKKASFGGLKQYVKDLDSNTLPPFLARLCDPEKSSSFSQEEVLCVFETAAEHHGCNILPHISQIVRTIIRILSSDPEPLYSIGCSKVVCTLSRYVIDPVGTKEEKSGIISSLCRPLSDCLMNNKENVSSGSALCVTALVQSNNWQFASDELVNAICLKVSGALEEVHCQTITHLGLVVALSKHNRLTLEPYGRSLIRSGLRILDESTKARNLQMIISSIQMIHSIMKSLDVSIISSEICSIIHAMERLWDDCMPEISTPAFQVAETAKKFRVQEQLGYDERISPLANYGGRHSRKGSSSYSVMADVGIRDVDPNDSLSDDVQHVHQFTHYDSHPSAGQYSDIPGSARARRRLYSNESDQLHQISNDDFLHTAKPNCHDDLNVMGMMAQPNSAGLVKSVRRYSDVPTRIADPCPMCLTPQSSHRSSQIARCGALSGNVRIQSTPRKQLQFYNSCSDSKRKSHQLSDSPALRHLQRCSGQCTDGEAGERKRHWDSIHHDNQCHLPNIDPSMEDLKFLSNNERSDSPGKSTCGELQAGIQRTSRSTKRNTNFLLLICAASIIMLLLAWWKASCKRELYVVPT